MGGLCDEDEVGESFYEAVQCYKGGARRCGTYASMKMKLPANVAYGLGVAMTAFLTALRLPTLIVVVVDEQPRVRKSRSAIISIFILCACCRLSRSIFPILAQP